MIRASHLSGKNLIFAKNAGINACGGMVLYLLILTNLQMEFICIGIDAHVADV